MATTKLPLDGFGNPIQAMFPAEAHSVAVSAASARTAADFDASTRVIAIYSTTNCHIKFGDNTVAATTSHTWIPAFTWLEFSIVENGTQHERIAVIRDTADGTFRITELR